MTNTDEKSKDVAQLKALIEKLNKLNERLVRDSRLLQRADLDAPKLLLQTLSSWLRAQDPETIQNLTKDFKRCFRILWDLQNIIRIKTSCARYLQITEQIVSVIHLLAFQSQTPNCSALKALKDLDWLTILMDLLGQLRSVPKAALDDMAFAGGSIGRTRRLMQLIVELGGRDVHSFVAHCRRYALHEDAYQQFCWLVTCVTTDSSSHGAACSAAVATGGDGCCASGDVHDALLQLQLLRLIHCHCAFSGQALRIAVPFRTQLRSQHDALSNLATAPQISPIAAHHFIAPRYSLISQQL